MDTIGTDHCPFPRQRKVDGLENIHDAPFGIPGVETTVRLMLNAVSEGVLTLNQLVHICCEQPARVFSIYPRKGCIQVGRGCGLHRRGTWTGKRTLRDADIVSKCKWTPFDGWTMKGAPVMTLVRGETVMEDGEVTGRAGYGKHRRARGGLRGRFVAIRGGISITGRNPPYQRLLKILRAPLE